MTSQEYLTMERRVDSRNEYLDGETWEMRGNVWHSIIKSNLIWALHRQSEDRLVQVHCGLRVRVNPTFYAYPDMSITAAEPQCEDEHDDSLLNPAVIIEILSPLTEAFDRRRKFDLYRQIESLAEYVLIAQDDVHVEHFVRQPGRAWLWSESRSMGDAVRLTSVGLTLKLADIFHRAWQP
jgi:Uma2 family endonuclease